MTSEPTGEAARSGEGPGGAPAPAPGRPVRAAVAAGVVLFAAVLLREAILGWSPLFGIDSHAIFARAYEYNAEEILSGRLPLWNPHWLLGVPYLADPQMAVLYPPAFVLFALLPAGAAASVYVVGHLAAAGILTYMLARRLGARPEGALLAGLVFSCTGALLPRVYAGHLSYIASAAYMPLVGILAHRLARRGLVSDALWLAVALAAQFLAGHPQVTVMTVLAGSALFALGVLEKGEPRGEGSVRRRILLGVLAAGLSAALSAAVLIPAAELVLNSMRAAQLTYRQATAFSVHPENLLTMVAPGFFGSARGYWGRWLIWEVMPWVGVMPLALALLAVIDDARKPRRLVLAGLAAAGLVLAMGRHLGVYKVLYLVIPGVDSFRAPGRFLLVFALAMALLAAEGVGVVIAAAGRRRSLRRALVAWGIVTALVVVLALVVSFVDPEGPFFRGHVTRRSWLPWGERVHPARISAGGRHVMVTQAQHAAAGALLAAGAVLGLLYLCYRRPQHARAMAAAAIGVTAVEILIAMSPYVRARSLPEWPPEVAEYLKAPREGARVIFAGRASDLGLVLKHRLETPVGYLAIMPRAMGQLSNRADLRPPLRHRVYTPVLKHRAIHDLLAVRHFIVRGNLGYRPVHLKKAGRAPGLHIYRSPHAMPRAFVVHGAATIPDEFEALERIVSPGFRFDEVVVLDREPPRKPHDPDLAEAPPALELSPERVKAEIVMETPGILVLTDAYFPGWRVTVDGRHSEIYRADHALRGVFLEEGHHEVVFEYRPLSFRAGLVVSLAALAAAVSGLLVLRLRRR